MQRTNMHDDNNAVKSRRVRVAVDMDEVIADAFGRHVSLYNQATGQHLSLDDIREKGLRAVIPAEHRAAFERIPHQEGFFVDLEVMPDSQRVLRALSQDFDVYITSAAMEVPSSFDAKFKWLQKHFPFIPTSRIVFCGDKGIINADFLVDDRSRHFASFRGQGILFTAPHNVREEARLRANNWDEVFDIVQREKALTSASES